MEVWSMSDIIRGHESLPGVITGGRAVPVLDGYFTHMPLLVLATIGARTGQPHLTRLAYVRWEDRYVVVAANAGSPRHPDWYHNLRTRPDALVEVDGERRDVAAAEMVGGPRNKAFEFFAAKCPQVMLYQASTSRRFPVIALVLRECKPPT
jgi:deazaflavin-dependent oxidoreductase (nitroreductase family)